MASLLAIAGRNRSDELADEFGVLTVDLKDDWIGVIGKSDDDSDLDKLVLWVEIKKQIEILRQGMQEAPEE